MSSEFPNLADPDEIILKIPNGMTEREFLKIIQGISQPTLSKKEKYPRCDTCLFGGPNNHCIIWSCTCATAIFNNQKPTRYQPKEGL